MTFRIIQGDNRLTLKTLADNSIDAIVTDPPYGIDFLGKAWDANTGALETYQECLRVLKPGGHILAFSAARTYHHLAVTLEQAGFEIRDQIMWIYSSGFPKSQDIGKSIQRSLGVKEKKTIKSTSAQNTSKEYTFTEGVKEYDKEYDVVVCTDPEAIQWQGWGTALKPAHEPIALARKPLHKSNSIARNCQQWGVGALNIDATRIEWDLEAQERIANSNANGGIKIGKGIEKYGTIGEDAEKTETKALLNEQGRFPSNVLGEILQADYQKYFYCPKVSRRERHIGFDTDNIHTATDMLNEMGGYYVDDNGNPDPTRIHNGRMIWLPHTGVIYSHTLKEEYKMWEQKQEKKQIDSVKSMLEDMSGYFIDNQGNAVDYKDRDGKNQVFLPHLGPIYIHGLKHEYEKWCKANNKISNKGNNHPTVKPVELMKYLIKLITPPGGIVLDPFNGSGSTGCAAVELGFDYIGCELDPAYVSIAETRIRAWQNKDCATNNYGDLFEE
jgi:DNA modification methylase